MSGLYFYFQCATPHHIGQHFRYQLHDLYIDNGFSRYGKQSFFYLMDVPAVEMCERLVKLFLVAIPEHTYIIVQRIGRQKHLLWLICRVRKKAAAHGKSRCGSFLCHITLFAEFYICSSMFKAYSDKYFYIALVAFLSHSSSSPSKSGLIAANTFAWYAFNLSFSSAVMQDTSTASRSNGTIVSGSKPMN